MSDDDWNNEYNAGPQPHILKRSVILSNRGRGRPGTTGNPINPGTNGNACNGGLTVKMPSAPPGGPDEGGGGDGDVLKEVMTVDSSQTGRLIGTKGATKRDLQEKSGCQIEIDGVRGKPTTNIEITGTKDQIEMAKELINSIVTRPGRSQQEDYNNNYSKRDFGGGGSSGGGGFNFGQKNSAQCGDAPSNNATDADEPPAINWKELYQNCEANKMAKWKDDPDIVKNFYEEHDEVTAMSAAAVAEFRKQNNNIVVMDLKDTAEGESPRHIPNPVTTFEHAFEKHPDVLREIYKNKFVKPSPIQSQMWPMVLSGYDTIGIAQTGTGKTLAFLLPAFLHIEGQKKPRHLRKGPPVLIMCPTRELALQIRDECKKYSYHDLKCLCIYGGGNRREQMKLCAEGQDVIIATPGRLNDLVAVGVIDVSTVSLLILDEADRMLDLGFEPQIMKILLDIRPDRQTLMTSATWPEEVRRLARTYMTDPMTVFVGSLDLATVHTVTQYVEIVDNDEKLTRLFGFIKELQPDDKAIVFAGRKSTADHISSEFAMQGISVQCLHGDRDQEDREQALKDLKKGEVRILIATDVASRGLDIQDITWVINYDFPRNMEEYVHRVGRTGRAGKRGKAISFLVRQDWGQAQALIDILIEAEQEVPEPLQAMADRYKAMRERRGADFKPRGGGRNQWRRDGDSVNFGGRGSKW